MATAEVITCTVSFPWYLRAWAYGWLHLARVCIHVGDQRGLDYCVRQVERTADWIPVRFVGDPPWPTRLWRWLGGFARPCF